MKNLVIIIVLSFFAKGSWAQDTLSHPLKSKDRLLPRFCIDATYMPGLISKSLNAVNFVNPYTQAVNAYATLPKFTNGSSHSINLQLGWFFGKQRHWGIGTGFLFQHEGGNLELDSLHVEYKSNDLKDTNSKFRQIITTNHKITEQVYSNNYSIPIMLKYKYQFGKNMNGIESKNRWGITADAGLIFSLQAQTHYSTNATFNYEAVYKLMQQGGKTVSVYDNAVTPGTTDWLITKAYQALQNPYSNTQKYFDSMYADGYNVKLGAAANNNAGMMSNSTFNMAALLQASLSYQMNYNLAFMLGGYFSYGISKYNADNNYRITDRVGTYNTMLNSISSSTNSAFGLNVGLRYYFGEQRDIDDDHVPDANDECPLLYGKSANGCPDRDGDGVPDNKDKCPDEAGPASNNGCPETIVKENRNANILPSLFLSQNIINFAYGKSDILSSAFPALDEIVNLVKANTTLYIFISGYTDNIGGYAANQALAEARAQSVAAYLYSKGISKERMIVTGYGKKDFLFDNSTPENRAKNRRVEIKFSYKL